MQNGRFTPNLLFFAGLVVLGIAGAVLLFGGTLLGEKTVAFEQVPKLGGETAVVQLPTGGGPIAVGDPAPAFTLDDLDGNSVTLADYAGKSVILNFWATWCAPCRIEMPELQKSFETHQDDGLTILALNQEEPDFAVRQFFYSEFDLTFTPLLDSEGTVSQIYGAVNLPTTVFINPEGQITAIHRGPVTAALVDGYLEGNQ